MLNITPSINNSHDLFLSRQESWENYLKIEPENDYGRYHHARGPSDGMMFEKELEPSHRMEEDFMFKNEEPHQTGLEEEFNFLPQANCGSGHSVFQAQNHYKTMSCETEDSECSRFNLEPKQEEGASLIIKDTQFQGFVSMESDNMSSTTVDDSSSADSAFDVEIDLTKRAMKFLKAQPEEEKAYIKKILPLLLGSLKEIYKHHKLPLNDQIVGVILKELLSRKKTMMGNERQVFSKVIGNEIEDLRRYRPDEMVTEDDLGMLNRKEKIAPKGNRNASNLNHLNENYVSNIFQFAKRNYPEDKEIQKLGNERNVSASNFRKLVSTKLTDSLLTRKAKARITECAKELIGNIEFWMKDGYFEQCADREKYIWHKEKALKDLALVAAQC
jgi:hypothetical protein